MQTVLDAEGYKVLETGDGNEALAQYALHQPDLKELLDQVETLLKTG